MGEESSRVCVWDGSWVCVEEEMTERARLFVGHTSDD